MLKFFTGTALGALLAFVFVRFGLEPPAIVKMPEKLKANLVTTAVEADLYDLTAAGDVRERALRIYFDNRAGDAAKLDAKTGHRSSRRFTASVPSAKPANSSPRGAPMMTSLRSPHRARRSNGCTARPRTTR